MEIDLPEDLTQRLKQRAASGMSEIDVIRQGLDALDWQDGERSAIQEGIEAMAAGQVGDFHEFDRQFRQQHGIAPDAS
ncbi:hypothetical protein M4951_16615 [Blastopirellula sp. J2-11]|uniref:hypothetical protein n=1 Tax=Blastopirellula sp. J2-11 TaxID=2943192 RepID=UPI0021CA96CB|nr:hypothetical protein [Blastopirellula sp. J2-11]UUO05003.1 hypothetical protein M4951_16615 [Blastopirellula sp. J2-11]